MYQNNYNLAERIIYKIIEKENVKGNGINFNNLLTNCHSMFPFELQEILKEMLKRKNIRIDNDKNYYVKDFATLNKFDKNQQTNEKETKKHFSSLMKKIHHAHCVDHEWWFTFESAKKILNKMLKTSPFSHHKNMVFLGAPILGVIASFMFPEIQIIILDKSQSTLNNIHKYIINKNLTLIYYNAEKPLPKNLIGITDFIFFDPPWYRQYYKLFLERSLLLSSGNNATISAILFPILTWSTAFECRNQVLNYAIDKELCPICLETSIANYCTPYFEKENLKSKGLNLKNWRKGDLVTFISNGKIVKENKEIKIEEFEWKEVSIGKTKIKIKIKPKENPNLFISPKIITISKKNDVLSSASKKYPSRKEIDLWTSTNIGIKIKGWKSIWIIVKGIAENRSSEKVILDIEKIFNIKIKEEDQKNIKKVFKELFVLIGNN